MRVRNWLKAYGLGLLCGLTALLTLVSTLSQAAPRGVGSRWDSRWIFEDPKTGQWIWIREARQARADAAEYQVREGRPGRWRMLAQAGTDLRHGFLRFRGGDGIYIPTLVGFFGVAPAPGEAPLLVRADGSLQALRVPKLSRGQIRALGFKTGPG